MAQDESERPSALLGRNLRRLRLAAGLSQEDLAERAGLHRTYVSSVERGNRNLTLESIYSLAAALGCDARDLLAPAVTPGDGK